jgi:hypothetical protein
MMNASVVEETAWEINGVAVELNINRSFYRCIVN